LQKPGELSVGVTVEVKHTAATPVGAWVEAEATSRAQDGKLYVFEVVARDLGGEVMRGVHKRESWGRHTQLRVPTLGNATSTSTTSTSTATSRPATSTSTSRPATSTSTAISTFHIYM
jgi:hypothetical protein